MPPLATTDGICVEPKAKSRNIAQLITPRTSQSSGDQQVCRLPTLVVDVRCGSKAEVEPPRILVRSNLNSGHHAPGLRSPESARSRQMRYRSSRAYMGRSSSATSRAKLAAARGRASRRRSRMRIPSGLDAAPVSGNPAPDSLCSAIHVRSAFSAAHRFAFRKSESIFLSQSAATSGVEIGAQRSFLIASSS